MRKIFRSLLDHGAEVLATRMSAEQADELQNKFPAARYNPIGRTFRISCGESDGDAEINNWWTGDDRHGRDQRFAVAEEARETALWTGAAVRLISDVGVAGPHRLTANLPLLKDAEAVVVVAGMEGLCERRGRACGLSGDRRAHQCGFWRQFGGVAALLGMLNSCAANT